MVFLASARITSLISGVTTQIDQGHQPHDRLLIVNKFLLILGMQLLHHF